MKWMEKNNMVKITLQDLPALSTDAFRITEEELYMFFTLGAANGFLKDESGKIDVCQSATFLRQIFEKLLNERLVYGDGGILKCSKKDYLSENKAVTEILCKLREMRNEQNDPELRRLYNEACERLDVLDSKLFRRENEMDR